MFFFIVQIDIFNDGFLLFAITLILKISKIVEVIFQIKGLRIWKMQLLDEEHILIKYASEEVVTLRSSEPNAQVDEKFFLNLMHR